MILEGSESAGHFEMKTRIFQTFQTPQKTEACSGTRQFIKCIHPTHIKHKTITSTVFNEYSKTIVQ